MVQLCVELGVVLSALEDLLRLVLVCQDDLALIHVKFGGALLLVGRLVLDVALLKRQAVVALVAVRGLLADQVGLAALGVPCLLALRVAHELLLLLALALRRAHFLVLEVLLAVPHGR